MSTLLNIRYFVCLNFHVLLTITWFCFYYEFCLLKWWFFFSNIQRLLRCHSTYFPFPLLMGKPQSALSTKFDACVLIFLFFWPKGGGSMNLNERKNLLTMFPSMLSNPVQIICLMLSALSESHSNMKPYNG